MGYILFLTLFYKFSFLPIPNIFLAHFSPFSLPFAFFASTMIDRFGDPCAKFSSFVGGEKVHLAFGRERNTQKPWKVAAKVGAEDGGMGDRQSSETERKEWMMNEEWGISRRGHIHPIHQIWSLSDRMRSRKSHLHIWKWQNLGYSSILCFSLLSPPFSPMYSFLSSGRQLYGDYLFELFARFLHPNGVASRDQSSPEVSVITNWNVGIYRWDG